MYQSHFFMLFFQPHLIQLYSLILWFLSSLWLLSYPILSGFLFVIFLWLSDCVLLFYLWYRMKQCLSLFLSNHNHQSSTTTSSSFNPSLKISWSHILHLINFSKYLISTFPLILSFLYIWTKTQYFRFLISFFF